MEVAERGGLQAVQTTRNSFNKTQNFRNPDKILQEYHVSRCGKMLYLNGVRPSELSGVECASLTRTYRTASASLAYRYVLFRRVSSALLQIRRGRGDNE